MCYYFFMIKVIITIIAFLLSTNAMSIFIFIGVKNTSNPPYPEINPPYPVMVMSFVNLEGCLKYMTDNKNHVNEQSKTNQLVHIKAQLLTLSDEIILVYLDSNDEVTYTAHCREPVMHPQN